MPFTNFDSRHFATTEKTAVNNAVTAIETALATKLANLTAEERQQYDSVNEQNKLIINKVKILNHRWIIADFSDGEYWGEVLIKYFINDDETVSFETFQSLLYQK